MDLAMSDDDIVGDGVEDESIEELLSGPKDSVMMFSGSSARAGRGRFQLDSYSAGDSLDLLTKEVRRQASPETISTSTPATSSSSQARRKLHRDLDNFLDVATRRDPKECIGCSPEPKDDKEAKRPGANDALSELLLLKMRAEMLEREKQDAVLVNEKNRADLESAHLEIWEMRQHVDKLDHEWREAMDAKAMSCAGLDEARQTLIAQQANFDALSKELSQLRGERDAIRAMSAVELTSLASTLAETMSRVQREHQRKFEELKDEHLCVVCMSERKNVVLQPCNHLSMCIDCFSKCSSSCPQCRSKVEGYIRIYN